MADDKWGGMDVAETTHRMRRISGRITGRFNALHSDGPQLPLRKILAIGAGVLVLLAIGGYLYSRSERKRAELEHTVAYVGAIHDAIEKLARAQEGKIPYKQGENLLELMIRRRYVDQSFDNQSLGFQVLGVAAFEGLPTQYAVAVQCRTDSRCNDLRAAFIGGPGFLIGKSHIGNPVLLTFDLDTPDPR